MSFQSASDDQSPMVVIYNPRTLSPQLLSQVQRYGLSGHADLALLSGKLKGTRKDFTQMIMSYGVGIEIVPAVL